MVSVLDYTWTEGKKSNLVFEFTRKSAPRAQPHL